MRTIKFRGKEIESGQWVYGFYTQGSFIGTDATRHLIHSDMLYDVIENTVCQFTGLTDKNGKEIYEGDVIGCHNPEIKHLIFYNEKQGRFMAALNGDIENDFIGVCGLDDRRWMASKDVIGNVHDNPELLNRL